MNWGEHRPINVIEIIGLYRKKDPRMASNKSFYLKWLWLTRLHNFTKSNAKKAQNSSPAFIVITIVVLLIWETKHGNCHGYALSSDVLWWKDWYSMEDWATIQSKAALGSCQDSQPNLLSIDYFLWVVIPKQQRLDIILIQQSICYASMPAVCEESTEA